MTFRIKHYKRAVSTNSLARAKAIKGAREGLVLVADYQTQGRGKPGNAWLSAPGRNLLFSVLLRPRISAGQAPLLTQIACRAVATTLDRLYAVTCRVKRPNDLLLEGRKLCGVLIETASHPTRGLDYAIIGIGLNVNAAPHDALRGVVSLKDTLSRSVQRPPLLAAILNQLREDLRGFGGYPA